MSLTLFLIALVLGITASMLYVVRQAMSREYVKAHTMISYPAMAAMAAVAVLFWIIILFMNIRYCGGFRYIGRCMSLIGIVNLSSAGAMYVLPFVLNRLFGLGYGFYIAFFNLQVRNLLYVGAVFLGCGILITLMGKLFRKIRKRILRRKLT